MSKLKLAVIEFGTSKIVTSVSRVGSKKNEVIGSGTVPYDGYLDGDWNTPDEIVERIHDSVAAAELESNQKITELYVGVPGDYIHVCSAEVEISLSGEHIPDSDDIDALMDRAAEQLHIAERDMLVLHRSAAWYQVDNGPKTMEIRDAGKVLSGKICFVLADTQFTDDITDFMGQLGITILGFVSTTFACSQFLVGMGDRDDGAVLIDCGYLTTEISVVHGDGLIYHAMLPMGGGHIAADLATELQIPMRSAEQIKRRFVFESTDYEPETYDRTGQRVRFKHEEINRIVERTMRELSNMIDMTISNDVDELLNQRSRFLVTGGGLKMRGAIDYLENRTGKTLDLPTQRQGKLSSEIYDSVISLADLVANSIEIGKKTSDESGFAGKMTGFLKRK